MDRSPLNVLEWIMLWYVLEEFGKVHNNANLSEDDKCVEYEKLYIEEKELFLKLKNSYLWKFFRKELWKVLKEKFSTRLMTGELRTDGVDSTSGPVKDGSEV